MAQYVKFMRGNPEAFERLSVKDTETLYFIYAAGASEGKLYLGDKLIAGGDIGSTSIDALKDVLISEGLTDNSILVYDSTKSQWVNKSLSDILTVFVGPTASSAGVPGLVPAPPAGQTNLFLRSDGTWAPADTDGPQLSHNIFSITNDSSKDHATIIAEQTTDLVLVIGDVIIIKDLLATGLYEHTAYVYDGSKWEAMDGNYDAENVYFKSDLMTTSAVGNITLTNGQATIAAVGKNLKQVFETIFVKEANPEVTDATISITASKNTSYEVGSKVTPTYTGTLNPGVYPYGPTDTGVTASNWIAVDTNAVTVNGQSGTFPEIVVEDGINYKITLTADVTDGAIPKTNVGNDYTAGQIKGGTRSITSGAITGYRKSFWGTLTSKDEMTSSTIRGLAKSSTSALANGSTFKITIPKDCLRVVFAYPATLRDVTSVLDKNDSNANIVSGFVKSTLDVTGANKHTAISYKVFTMDFANPYDTANEFSVTI